MATERHAPPARAREKMAQALLDAIREQGLTAEQDERGLSVWRDRDRTELIAFAPGPFPESVIEAAIPLATALRILEGETP